MKLKHFLVSAQSLAIAGLFAMSVQAETVVKTETRTAPAPAKKLYAYQFKDVCSGIGLSGATAYEKKAGIHPVLIFDRNSSTAKYVTSYKQLPPGWKADYKAYQKTELVACLTATKRTLSKKCPIERDGIKRELHMYDTAYDAQLFEAKTGKKLAESKFDLKAAANCPTYKYFGQNEMMKIEDADYRESLLQFLKGHAQVN